MNSPPFHFYKCDICTFRTKSFLTFQNHEMKPPNLFNCESSTLEEYKCTGCSFKTNLKVHLFTSEHFKATERTSNDRIFCHNCSLETSSILIFLGHRCRKRAEKPYACGQCSYRGRLEHHLSIHKTFKHPSTSKIPTKWHQCPRCSYRTKLETDLHSHVAWKHGNLDEWFECDQCPYRGRMKHHLTIHKTLKHTPAREAAERPELPWYECDQCSFRTREEEFLGIHIVSEHPSPEKWYECGQCGFKSMTKANLTYHRRVTHPGMLSGSNVIDVRRGESGCPV